MDVKESFRKEFAMLRRELARIADSRFLRGRAYPLAGRGLASTDILQSGNGHSSLICGIPHL